MVAGRDNDLKIGAIIQARIGSARLPEKVLMPLPYPYGKPLLGWVIDSLHGSKKINRIVVATSEKADDDAIEKFCEQKNISCLRGSEDDVLRRFLDVIARFNFDIIIRVTGDNPIIDAGILDSVIEFHIRSENEYTVTQGLPTGMNIEVVSTIALRSISNLDLTAQEREHVTLFFAHSNSIKKAIVPFDLGSRLKNLRLTIDYPSDLALMSLILAFASEVNKPGLAFIENLLKSHKWIFDINSTNFQRVSFPTAEAEIQAAISSLEQNAMYHAANVLKKHG
ncbi:MAG: glycosyltransferase family protein [Chryseolinea sp.]